MRRPEYELDRLLRVQGVHWPVELGRNGRRYKTNSPGAQTTPAQPQTASIMQVESIATKKSPPSAFQPALHPCKRSTATTILLTLSFALVLFSVAFASTSFTTTSAAKTTTTANPRHHHNHLRDLEQPHSSRLNSGNHRRPRHSDAEMSVLSGRHASESSRLPRNLLEQRRLRNLIAKTSSISKLPRVQHHKRATAGHDKPSAAVQNQHGRRRYRFYDNEIHYPKASKHFGSSASHLDARSSTIRPDRNPYGFSMHDDFKFWDDPGHDRYGDEFDDVDSLDVDLDEDDDEDAEDDEEDEDLNGNEDEGVDEGRVPKRVDGIEENMITSRAKYRWKGSSSLGDKFHPKTRYHAKHTGGHHEQQLSPVIARAHHNALQHDDHSDLFKLHARSEMPWSHYNRHHVHGQSLRQATEQDQRRVSQVPYQSPIVVSISDNSFVSASPPVIVGLDANREKQQHQRTEHNKNAIDAMATDDEPDGDRLTTSIDDETLERHHVLASNNSGSDIGSLLNITAYNRVETSTRRNRFISDHHDGVSRHRKVHLLQPLASGNTLNNYIENSITYSRVAPPSVQPGRDVGVYTTQADRIDSHNMDETGSYQVVGGSLPPPKLALTNGRTTYRYELELTATTTPASSEVAFKSMTNKTGEDKGSSRTNDDDDTVDGQDDDDDETDKNDDDDDDIDLDEDDENSLTIDSVKIHPKSMDNYPERYSHIIASPNNELPSYGRQYWHTPHRASIQLVHEEPNKLHRGSINSAIIATLFGIGAMGMLIMIVSIKMGSIRERVAYKGRRRSLVPDTDFLINTIPI